MTRKQPVSLAPGRHKTIGLFVGTIAFAIMLVLPAPASVGNAGWSVAALAALMAIWWMTEAVPLAATALLPIVVLPMLGVGSLESVAHSYAHPLIFMFLSGFFIGKALERWNLHSTIANMMIQRAPHSAEGIIGAIMLATAFLSMWISNTATALVMVSIAQSITQQSNSNSVRDQNYSQSTRGQFSTALMLGVAFSATVGGMATIIGTPPNALLVAYLQNSHDITIGFGQWMGIGVPLVLVMLPVTWVLLTRILFPLKSIDLNTLGYTVSNARSTPLPSAARIVALVAFVTALALIFRPFVERVIPEARITDAGILMSAALLLLVLPAPDTKGERLLPWKNAENIRWDVLILFGGGLALASAVEATGLAGSVGNLFSSIEYLPAMVVILIAMVTMVLIGELASNTAMAAVFLPITGAAAVAMGIPLLELVIPIGLAASLGFMLPVATPPNAIAFGSGNITSGQLLKAGALLDVIGIVIVYIIAVLLGPIVFGR